VNCARCNTPFPPCELRRGMCLPCLDHTLGCVELRVRELADGLDAAVAWIDENTTVEQHEAWKRSANCGAAEKARKA
jgi:hypothetical protein